MSVITLPAPPAAEAPPDPRPASTPNALDRYFSCLSELTSQPAPWDRTSVAAMASLVLLWAARFYTTWATWGDLTVDCGREMYVPAMLAQGKMLYRDVWYGYFPLAPYLNAFLFRLFGSSLNVLYWAGSLAALACAILIFLTGKRLSSPLAGWTVGAVVLMQAFHAWIFSFPLAYSFAAIYGCVAACLFLWCAVHAGRSGGWKWMLAAASSAAVALLVKLEFGAACYITFFFLAVARGLRRRSWKLAATDLAATLPGLLACGLVACWMVSIGGLAFITQENLAASWPTSFQMTRYGKLWLENNGLSLNMHAYLQSGLRTLFLAGVIVQLHLLLSIRRRRLSATFLALFATLLAASVAYCAFVLKGHALDVMAAVFFPLDMVLYAAIASLVYWWHLSRQEDAGRGLEFAVLLTLAALMALRTLLRTTPWGYSIYCNPPAVLAFLILARPLVPRIGSSPRSLFRRELLLCLGCLAVAAVHSVRFSADLSGRAPLRTEFGTIIVPGQVAEGYRAAIALMKQEHQAGRMVFSVPEDTSLYFLSGTESPTRLFAFLPGLLVPGKMTDDLLREIESKRVRYVLWSNRIFPDYGAPRFGTDFDQTLGNYLTSHYHSVGPLIPNAYLDWQTSFTLWERKSGVDSQPR
jgi:hypothetical protein